MILRYNLEIASLHSQQRLFSLLRVQRGNLLRSSQTTSATTPTRE